MRFTLQDSRLGLRNSHTRIPFRYGNACLTSCPQVVLEVTIASAGRVQRGYSGDCLPPGWFDKSAGKDFATQIEDMLGVIAAAERIWKEERKEAGQFFPAWREAERRVQEQVAQLGLPALLAGLGSSLVERAVMDAMCRLAGQPLFEAVRGDLFGIRPGEVHPELEGWKPADWLPAEPRRVIHVRHTVGLGDPLTPSDVAEQERLDDGFPQTLEDYVRQTGLRYLKLKVSNRLEHDLERLRAVASIVQRVRGEDYAVTLDGNEQYASADQFDGLIDAVRSDPDLQVLWRNVLLIEQPLQRHIALDERHTQGIRSLSEQKPVIIDESDAALDSYRQALRLGYRGVSSKNCKGPIKSLLNLGLTRWANRQHSSDRFLMSAEDLCTVGVIPVQSDLCLVAMLGMEHVERNGHHFHPGLSYLPAAEQRAALDAHSDFYQQRAGRVAPHLVDGTFRIGSLQCPGFGFSVLPDMNSMVAPRDWDFASLNLT